MKSLRTRLFVATFGTTALIFLAAGAMLYWTLRVWAIGELDERLRLEAETIASLVEREEGRLQFEWEDARLAALTETDRPGYFQVWASSGRVLAYWPDRGDRVWPEAAPSNHLPRFVTLPDGRPGRRYDALFPVRDEHGGIHADAGRETVAVSVATDTLALSRSLRTQCWLLVGVFSAAGLLSAGMMLLLVRRELHPVADLAEKIDSVDARHLGRSVALDRTPAELVPIVDRLNEMLDRLRTAMERERAFTADVAHELRTPLASLDTALEVAASRGRSPEDYQSVLGRCLAVVRQMSGLVQQLLQLARADAGQTVVVGESVDLKELLRQCWQSLEPLAASRRGPTEWDLPDDSVVVTTDREKMRLVLVNVLDNAIRHGDPSDSIKIALRYNKEGNAVVRVENGGCRVSAEEVSRVFDRFWKHDTARSGSADHAGLGLALCRTMLTLMGGTITAEVDGDERFIVTIELPRTSDQA